MKRVMAYHTNAYRRAMRAVSNLHLRYDATDDISTRVALATEISRRMRDAERHELYINEIRELIRDGKHDVPDDR